MAELTLTSLPSGNAVQGVQAAGAPTSATGTQPALPTLPSGALISGFVLNRDTEGNPVLRTPQGDFTVQSDLFLKIGSDVVARITTPGDTAHASILSVDGHSPQDAETAPANAQASGQQAASSAGAQPRTGQNAAATQTQQTAQSPAVVRQSTTITGTLIRPATGLLNAQQPGTQQASEADPSLPAGTKLTFRLVSATPPQAQAQAPTEEEAPANASSTPTQTPATSSQQYSAYTRPPVANTITMPAQTATQAAQTPQAAAAVATTPRTATQTSTSTVQARVTSQDAAGNSVAETPMGTVRLENAPVLPTGTRLTLEVLNTATAAAAAEPDATPADIATLASGWQSLGQIIDTLTQLSPDAATHFMRLAMPASSFGAVPQMENLYPTAENLTAGINKFANALTGGDLFTWLGAGTTEALQDHEHAPLLARAADEFDSMRALWVDAKPGTWQAMFIPIMAEGQVRQLRMFVKRERKNKERTRQADTRFVVEMELSATGTLQLDGLVRKREGATQFDLMIRSRNGFTPEEQRDIMGIYTAIGGATGYSGSVTFQQTNEFPVRPLEEILAARHKAVVA